MRTIKIIDLLNKIANGEEVPKKFMFEDREFYLQSKDCWRCDNAIFEECFILEDLNKEVEIIEEDKKIEKLDIYNCFKVMGIDKTGRLDENFNDISNKINEIIEFINDRND